MAGHPCTLASLGGAEEGTFWVIGWDLQAPAPSSSSSSNKKHRALLHACCCFLYACVAHAVPGCMATLMVPGGWLLTAEFLDACRASAGGRGTAGGGGGATGAVAGTADPAAFEFGCEGNPLISPGAEPPSVGWCVFACVRRRGGRWEGCGLARRVGPAPASVHWGGGGGEGRAGTGLRGYW